jgi:hypothetical protein
MKEIDEIFESKEFKKALLNIPEKDREKVLEELKKYAAEFYDKVISPIKTLTKTI